MAKLILLRHGQSLWNREGRFTGWMDIDLSEIGRAEARDAGRILSKSCPDFDIAYTSLLKRAIRTLWIVLDEMDRMWTPSIPSWRLNERAYGDLEGKSKKEMEEKYGTEQVHRWRRGFYDRPPAMPVGDIRHPRNDPRYGDLDAGQIPVSESLQDTLDRLLPLWQGQISAELQEGKNVLIVSHGNTIRALVKHIENISDKEIERVEIPTAVPLLYELDGCMRPRARRYLGGLEYERK